MKIIVLVKEVPDTYGDRKLDLETGLADRAASDAVLDEINERCVEAALKFAETHDSVEVLALSVAPENASTTIRKALAMGADRAIQVVDEDLQGSDIMLTAEVLAAALRNEGFDLIIAGNAATDGMSGMIPAAIAEHLGIPALTTLSSVEISDSLVVGKRAVDGGTQSVESPLPAIISITDALPEGRFPSFKGTMAAKKKPYETLNLQDLGLRVDTGTAPRSIMLSISEKPPRASGMKIIDEGNAGEQIADFLIENRLA